MTNVSIIGLDIAKSSFSLHGNDSTGRTVLKRDYHDRTLNHQIAHPFPLGLGPRLRGRVGRCRRVSSARGL